MADEAAIAIPVSVESRAGEPVNPNGVARRLGRPAEHPSNAILMETVVCSKCGQRFAIRHDPGFQDIELAKKQAAWVIDQLVWDTFRSGSGSTTEPSSCRNCNKIR